MSAQRAARREKALAFLRARQQASALEIGAAAVKGEGWAGSRKVWKAVETIGLQLAIGLMKAGHAQPTRNNHFRITTPAA